MTSIVSLLFISMIPIQMSYIRVVLWLQIGGCQSGECFINLHCMFSSIFNLHRASEGGSCATKVDNGTSSFNLTTHQRIGIFGAILTGAVILVMVRASFSLSTCLAAARNLHNKMFIKILCAPILFFDTNPVGKHLLIN